MQYLKLAWFGVLCLVMVGCTAAKQDPSTTSASTEWRLKSLEESFLNFRERQREQADQSEEQAEAVNERLMMLEEQIAALKSGQTVVDAPEEGAETPPVDQGWVTDLRPEDEKWVDGPADDSPAAQSDEEKPWDKVPGPPPVIPEPTVVERDKPMEAKKPAPAKTPKASSAKSMYDEALAQYNAGNYPGARAAFDAFIQKYPKNSLVPNALYWKGETYYSQKDYAQSILAFKEVTGRFPKHAKAAAALLKIGMSYDRVGDPDNAIFYLRALVEDFPGSAPARTAKKELARLGG